MRFFQKCLQLILQTDFVPRSLIPCARQAPPQTLFAIGHKAQDQLLGNQPLHQTFRIAKVILASAPSAIGQCLCQMECSRHFPGTFPFLTARFPVPFQCAPQRFPVLRRGFHHHFLDLLLDQPLRKQSQVLGSATVPASLKLVFVVDFNVSHNYGQLFLWTSIPAILYGIRFLLAGAESVPEITLSRVAGSCRSHGGERQRTIYSLYHARSGLDRSTVSASPL